MEIDKKFWSGSSQPVASTVGALRQILAELPNDLKLSDLSQVVVANYRAEGLETVCSIEAIDEDTDDYDSYNWEPKFPSQTMPDAN